MMEAEGTATSAASRLVLKEAAAPSHNRLTCRGAGADSNHGKEAKARPSVERSVSPPPPPLSVLVCLPAPGW